jgi:pantoate--beta-alanine ligase
MGALHPGHISLIDISKNTTDITVCSIFVNPTQFNDPKDFQKYPITIEKDIFLLEKAGTEVLFLPEAAEMYPGGTKDLEKYELGRLETLLEGKYRPGHFQGVCQVMRRLLDMVVPDDLFMGQKDYQQCMVVSRLLEIMRSSARLHPSPILREPDGLAMSSRNVRLTAADREKAPAIYQALTLVKEEWDKTGDPIGNSGGVVLETILTGAKAILEGKGFRIDYLEVADAKTLEPVGTGGQVKAGTGGGPKTGQPAAVALVAAFLGEIRLIDNMLL